MFELLILIIAWVFSFYIYAIPFFKKRKEGIIKNIVKVELPSDKIGYRFIIKDVSNGTLISEIYNTPVHIKVGEKILFNKSLGDKEIFSPNWKYVSRSSKCFLIFIFSFPIYLLCNFNNFFDISSLLLNYYFFMLTCIFLIFLSHSVFTVFKMKKEGVKVNGEIKKQIVTMDSESRYNSYSIVEFSSKSGDIITSKITDYERNNDDKFAEIIYYKNFPEFIKFKHNFYSGIFINLVGLLLSLSILFYNLCR